MQGTTQNAGYSNVSHQIKWNYYPSSNHAVVTRNSNATSPYNSIHTRVIQPSHYTANGSTFSKIASLPLPYHVQSSAQINHSHHIMQTSDEGSTAIHASNNNNNSNAHVFHSNTATESSSRNEDSVEFVHNKRTKSSQNVKRTASVEEMQSLLQRAQFLYDRKKSKCALQICLDAFVALDGFAVLAKVTGRRQENVDLNTLAIGLHPNSIESIQRHALISQEQRYMSLHAVINRSEVEECNLSGERELLLRYLTLMGRVYSEMKMYDSAIDCFDAALRIRSNDVDALHALALVLQETSPSRAPLAVALLRKAAKSCESARRFVSTLGGGHECQKVNSEPTQNQDPSAVCRLPSNTEISRVSTSLAALLTDIGVRLKLAELSSDAIVMYNEALNADPSYAQAYYNLGVVYAESGSFSTALEYYAEAVRFNPALAEAFCNTGVIHKQLGNLRLAIVAYEQALAVNPNFELARRNLAIALCDAGTACKATDAKLCMKYYKRAVSLAPTHADAYYNMGVAYGEARKYERALSMYELATKFNPRHTEAHNNLGVLYKDLGNLERAVACYQSAIQVNPRHYQTHNNLAVVYTLTGSMALALKHFRSALAIEPSYAEAHNNIGVLLRDDGDMLSSIGHYEMCIQLDPNAYMAGQNRLHALNYVDNLSPRSIYEEHAQWGVQFSTLMNQNLMRGANSGVLDAQTVVSLRDQMKNRSKSDRTRLRVGYISADFFTHSVSYFAEVLLKCADQSKFEIFVYSNVAREDSKTARLKSYSSVASSWRTVFGLSTAACARLILEDKIDILVELSGHTAGNRLDVMALQVAPVQVTWIGYPNTTGLKEIQYRVTDALVDPVESKQQYTEKLYRLSDAFLCYTPLHDAPKIVPSPCLSSGGWITFGSFNVLAKMQPKCVSLWARVLRSVPNSRLVLKAKPFACEESRRRVELLFDREGLSADRLDLLPLLPATRSHLETYSSIDIALDPFPYAGTTTTCEALYMGVPVVTLRSNRDPHAMFHAHDVGVTLLSATGHQEWIAKNEVDYIRIAKELAMNPEKLSKQRESLRSQMMSSPLGNTQRYMTKVEQMFQYMWKSENRVDKPI